MSADTEIKWDGKTYPYVPSDPLHVDPTITFHDAIDRDLEPIAFEYSVYFEHHIKSKKM